MPVVFLIVLLLSACSTVQPELKTLYQTNHALADQPPVILIHGAFGGRLCAANKAEQWPGGILDLVFNEYQSLALSVPGVRSEDAWELSVCGLADTIAGQDFYGRIENTLVDAGGYALARAGEQVSANNRNYYRFVYDWRQDNARSAAKLDALVEQIRRDYQDPKLKVDIIAHSMGGLVTRYWMRYGATDVLDDNEFPINNQGGNKVRKVILVGTPNLGSTSALQQLLSGADFGVNKIAPEILITFPSAYQLLPHPIVDSVLGDDGRPLDRDIYDIDIWRALEWGPYDPKIKLRLMKQGQTEADIEALVAYAEKYLERARRFVWSLTIKNQAAPYELIMFGGDCQPTPARILIEEVAADSKVRLWPTEMRRKNTAIDYHSLMLEPGDGAVTKASLLARTELDPSIPRHRFSDFPLDYSVMFCEDHSQLTGNLTFQDNLLHILLSR